MADPKVDEKPQAGEGVDPQAGKTGEQAKSQADEPMSVEKARELRAEAKNLRDRLHALEAAQKTRDDEAKAAEEAKAKEEGRLADVLKKRDDEVAALKPRADLAAKLEALFVAQLEDESKEWPEEIKAMVPEGLEARIDAMPKLRALVAKLTTAPPARGNGPSPKPTGATPASDLEAAKARLRAGGGYSRF